MPSVKIMKKIEEFLRQELSDISFQDLCYADFSESSYEDPFVKFLQDKLPNCYDIRSGATKVVLFYKEITNLGYCVKIPYQGLFHEEECFDENLSWDSDYELLVSKCLKIPFKRANKIFPFSIRAKISSWDYCEIEKRIGDLAEERGIDSLFARTYYLCSINDYPIYISEIVDSTMIAPYDEYKSPTWESSYEIGCNINDQVLLDDEAVGFFVDNYGREACCKLLDFLYEYGIGDFHEGNIGFSCGFIQLIDYSGFND